jgi:hypothetical protein
VPRRGRARREDLRGDLRRLRRRVGVLYR